MTEFIKNILSRNRILVLAVLASLACHVFWLSIVRVAADRSNVVKFSKVSFLGQILESSAIEIRVKGRDMSFLEKRYKSGAERLGLLYAGSDQGLNSGYDPGDTYHHDKDRRLARLIDEVVSGVRMEPA